MLIEIREESPQILFEYEKIPISFEVKSVLRIELIDKGLGGIQFTEKPVAPYVKDYDVYEKPSNWLNRFELKNWGILSAYRKNLRVGGAVVAWNMPKVEMLENRADIACLWDLRVAPGFRQASVGHQLFSRAVEWSRERGCRNLKVETQNTNVPACKFYLRQGCELRTVDTHAYGENLNEVLLLWHKNI